MLEPSTRDGDPVKIFGVSSERVADGIIVEADRWDLRIQKGMNDNTFLSLDLKGTNTTLKSYFSPAPGLNLEVYQREIEDHVRAMLDEHSRSVSAVYESLPEPPEPDVPESITIFGVECPRVRLAGDDVVEYQGRNANLYLIATALEHTVSPEHHMEVVAEWSVEGGSFETTVEAPLQEIDAILQARLRIALAKMAVEADAIHKVKT